jgi:hypothetical protein
MPSAVWISFDPEAVVDLRVVTFAEQRRVLQAGLSAVGPVQDVVYVAPPGRRLAPGEHAALVAQLHGAAQVLRHHPVGAAEVHRHRVGADDDAGDGAVTGQHPRPSSGDGRP